MPDYFKPLRRKIGAMTLMVALVFAGLWIRGQVIWDEFRSCNWFPSSWGLIFDNGQRTIQSFGQKPKLYGSNSMRFMFEAEDYIFEIIEIPHWLIVIPLTLLSTWLLLNKPRPANLDSLR